MLFQLRSVLNRQAFKSCFEIFPGAVQLKLRAGSAVPICASGIHRGSKFPGKVRRSLFIVYGTGEEGRHSSKALGHEVEVVQEVGKGVDGVCAR